jgi:ribosome modulation factor
VSTWFGMADVLIEGCTDYYCGRPRTQNPYCPTNAADAHAAWLWGWDEGRAQLEDRGQAEAARWLSEAA